MKKMFRGLCTLLLCLLFSACGDLASKMTDIAENMANNCNEWTDEDQWYSALEDAAQCFIDFSESNPDKESFDKFMNAYATMNSALYSIDSNECRNARDKARKKLDRNSDLQQQLKKAMKEMEKLEESFK